MDGYDPGLDIDILPPSKIKDFKSVDRTYRDNRTVELIWTAVGDDFDQGIGKVGLHISSLKPKIIAIKNSTNRDQSPIFDVVTLSKRFHIYSFLFQHLAMSYGTPPTSQPYARIFLATR